MKTRFACLMVLTIFCGGVFADVIRLNDGKIYLGKIFAGEAGVSVVESGSEKKVVNQADIIKTESDLSTLKNQSVDVVLKDGSTVNGKINDYDPEVGILLDIAFGTLTIPFESIRYVSDPVQRNIYNGSPFKIGLAGGYYFTIGDLREDFTDSFTATLFAELNITAVRGLFAGIRISYINLAYDANTYLSYLTVNAQAYLSYRILSLRTLDSFLNRFVPFVSVGLGGAYINASDSRSGYSSQNLGEIDLAFSAELGVDFYIIDNLLLRISGIWGSILQETTLFNTLSANAGLAWCF